MTETAWAENGVTLSVSGEIDLYTAAEVRQRIHQLVDTGRTRVIADLHGVNYLDSTGLGVLIGALRRTREQDGNMVIVCSQPRLMRIFEITGINRILRILPDEASAREVFGG